MKSTQNLIVLATLASLGLPALAKIPVTVTLPKSAKPAAAVTVSVKTEKESKCKIEAQDAGFTQTLKLMDQTADKTGKAHWKFNIPKDYKADGMPVIVTVIMNDQEEKVTNSIAIKKAKIAAKK